MASIVGHDAQATIAIAEAIEPEEEEERDFESWFFEEPIVEEIGAVSCAVAYDEKPQENAKLAVITKEGDDDVETTPKSVVVKKKAAKQSQYEKLPNVKHQEDQSKKSKHRQVRKDRTNNKMSNDPDGCKVSEIKITPNWH